MYNQLSKEARNRMKEEIKSYFYNERDEEIGEIATDSFLEFCMEKLGPYFYNEGVQDAIKIINERNMQSEDDLYSLKRPVSR
ncbi:hypothetical protein WQ54_22910 [Bacillus sp. SA1-12]|uniref:DUF2164 domain-containing protein n=1 Tax=Bacillus sp. SA1-12 TaxID=1455638 RepID=UPI0006273D5C|nr:DUF2164 domain-containing protein [Bacillus sp. SA1-12]KKI89989.1 hypothetical protein WQ54_22910 [Bacillus sp. SA1-12]